MARNRIMDGDNTMQLPIQLEENLTYQVDAAGFALATPHRQVGRNGVVMHAPVPGIRNLNPYNTATFQTQVAQNDTLTYNMLPGAQVLPSGINTTLITEGIFEFEIAGVTAANKGDAVFLNNTTKVLSLTGASGDWHYGHVFDVPSAGCAYVILDNPVIEAVA